MDSEENETSAPGHQGTVPGVIPQDWEVDTVGHAFEICNNLRFPINQRTRERMQGEYPYYGPTGIQGYINEFRVQGEYVLIGEDGDHFLKWRNTPMTLLVRGKFNVNNHAHLVRGFKNETRWFYYFFSHRDLTPYLTRQGAGRYKLTKNALAEIPCALPLKNEQVAISAALGDLDAFANSLDRLLAKKRLITLATMQQLLTGRKRLPGYIAPWAIKPLCQLLTFIQTANNPRRDLDNQDGVAYVHYGDVHGHPGSTMDCMRMSLPRIRKTKVGNIERLQNGDLVIADASEDYAGIGKSLEVEITDGLEVVGGLHTIVCRGVSGKWAKGFKGYLQFIPAFKSALIRAATGISVFGISKKHIGDVAIALPEPDEQEAIVSVLRDMDSEIAALERRRDKIKAIKQGMMQALLTGRIRLIKPGVKT